MEEFYEEINKELQKKFDELVGAFNEDYWTTYELAVRAKGITDAQIILNSVALRFGLEVKN